MSMIDPNAQDGDTVLATQSGGQLASDEGSGSGSGGNTTQNPVTGATPQSSSTDLPLVEIQGPGPQGTKLSPTDEYVTDRYRLARPFTTQL